jgi:hypothetical protein
MMVFAYPRMTKYTYTYRERKEERRRGEAGILAATTYVIC